jgi:hypothetical protein
MYTNDEIERIALEIRFDLYADGDFSDQLCDDRDDVINRFDNVIFNYTNSMNSADAKIFRKKIFDHLGI